MRFSIRTLLIVVTCSALLFAAAAIGFRTFVGPRSFSPTVWKMTFESRREAMANDFIANHFRPGMSRTELIALLGEPDPGFNWGLNYIIGHRMIDYVVLLIQLDDQGKAVTAMIFTTS